MIKENQLKIQILLSQFYQKAKDNKFFSQLRKPNEYFDTYIYFMLFMAAGMLACLRDTKRENNKISSNELVSLAKD